mgnify:CR=1 FL=1
MTGTGSGFFRAVRRSTRAHRVLNILSMFTLVVALVPLAPAAAGTQTYSSADPSTSGIAPEPFGGNLSCAGVAPAGATWSWSRSTTGSEPPG